MGKDCAPGKDCCDDCKVAPLVVWGPISDEVPSRDNPPKLIRLTAIEEAFPQLLARGLVDVNHNSALVVARLHALAQVDVERAPLLHQSMVREVSAKHGGLPSGMVVVTPAIAAVFPRIAHRLGERLPFAACQLMDDNRTTAAARKDILEGRLDSFSLAGAQFDVVYARHCDPTGCRTVQEIPSMDLSALTLTSHSKTRSLGGESQAANPGAGFVVVQQTASVRVETSLRPDASGGGVAEPAPAVPANPEPAAAAPAQVDVVVQTAAPVVPAPGLVVVPAAIEPVKQSDAPEASAAPAAVEAPKTDLEAVVAQIVKRLTDLETDVALVKGRREEAPAPEAPVVPVKEEEKEEEKPAAKKDGEVVKEATALKQTIPQPAAETAASTPTPISPGKVVDTEFQAILQDMDNGDPSALKRIRHTIGGRKA